MRRWFDLMREVGDPLLWTARRSQLARRPTQRAPTDEMHMEVENRLSGAGSDIQNCAVAVFDGAIAGNLGRDQVATSN